MVVMLITVVSIFSQIPTKGLVCFFPFTGDYKDACGNIVLTTTANGAPIPVMNKDSTPNSAYLINRKDNKDNILKALETNKLPSGNSDITISVWVKLDLTAVHYAGERAVIASWGTDTSNQKKEIVLYWDNLPSSYYFLGVANGVDTAICKMPTNTEKAWFHAAVVIKSGTVKLFVNGTTSIATAMTFNIQAGGALGLGTDINTSSIPTEHLNGCLDDVAIYNRALSDDEINYIRSCKSTKNVAPAITSTALTAAKSLETYTYNVIATDVDNQTVTLSLPVKPNGMTLSGNIITWKPTNEQAGKNKVTIMAKDILGDSALQTFEIDVEATTGVIHSIAPVFTKQQSGNIFYLPNGRICQKNFTRGLIVSSHMKRIIVR